MILQKNSAIVSALSPYILAQQLTAFTVHLCATYQQLSNMEVHQKKQKESMTQGNPCPLSALPELAMVSILTLLDRTDHHSLVSTCRSFAASVSLALQGSRVTVTSSTRLAPLCKVLATNTVKCKDLTIWGDFSCSRVPMPNAVDMLLRSDVQQGYELCGIQTLTIMVGPPPCLLPPTLARMLPDLQVLRIFSSLEHVDGDTYLRPLPYCSSLRSVYLLGDGFLQMPSKYHTPEDLRKQLPNVSELHFSGAIEICHAPIHGHVCCVETMLQAWGAQLTRLEITTAGGTSTDDVMLNLLQCTQLQSLEWYLTGTLVFTLSLPMSLTSSTLNSSVDESSLQFVLQLPLLQTLSIERFSEGLQQKWSNQPCSWQQLKFHSLPIVDLSKLPLHSLKGERCLDIQFLVLPHPMLADSLAKVAHAAKCVKDANITISGVHSYHCDAWIFDFRADIASAELLRAAGSCVELHATYTLSMNIVSSYPQTAAELFQQSSPIVRCVTVPRVYVPNPKNPTGVQPWFWEALLCCSNLERVEFPSLDCDTIAYLVLQASVNIMANVNRQFSLVFPSAFVTEDAIAGLQLRLHEELPAFVNLLKDHSAARPNEWVCTLKPVKEKA